MANIHTNMVINKQQYIHTHITILNTQPITHNDLSPIPLKLNDLSPITHNDIAWQRDYTMDIY